MTGSRLCIGVLLPDVLGTYSDVGNAVVLAQRARWRGIQTEIIDIPATVSSAPSGCDIYLLGGGEDTAQRFGVSWLAGQGALLEAISDRATTLAVCAGLQILGHSMTDLLGARQPGLGLLDVTTAARRRRAVGEIVTECVLPEVGLLTGFENHAGATTLGPGVAALGRVLTGVGNGVRHGDGGARVDGVCTERVIATYLHGPVLARNPALADHLLHRATGMRLDELDLPEQAQLRRTYLGAKPRRAVGSRRRR